MLIYDLLGDESFDPGTLNATAQTWHTRLLAQDVTQLGLYTSVPNAPDNSTGVELLGETMAYEMLGMTEAFRVTGDLAILDMMDTLMERAVTPLITNGYMLTTSHQGQTGLAAMLNQMAWIYTLNSGLTSPAAIDYSARATQWATYIDVTYYPVWGVADAWNLRHRTSATLRSQYYHWRRTGTAASWYEALGWEGNWDQGFIAYIDYLFAENRQDLNPLSVDAVGQLLSGNRYIMDQGSSFPWQPTIEPYGWIDTNYVVYMFCNFIDLSLEGIYPFGTTIMQRYANTAAWVMASAADAGLVRDSVDDVAFTEGRDTGDLITRQWGSIFGLGRFLSSLTAWADTAWSLKGVGPYTSIPSWALVATV